MTNVQVTKKFPKRPKMNAFEDQDINQLYEQFKNETNRITESIVGIKRNPKTEGLGKEVEDLCKQRRNGN